MLKLTVRNKEANILDELNHLNSRQIKSKVFYPGYITWFNNIFVPDYLDGGRDIISVRDKRYGTLVGFVLLKTNSENKICNLSPLVDGVGLTQALLDSALQYFSKDFNIEVPLNDETIRLHSKLNQLGFEIKKHTLSKDNVPQITYIKPMNISWI